MKKCIDCTMCSGEILKCDLAYCIHTAVCKLEVGTVKTFDNVTYDYPLSDCYHILAKDCSRNIKMAVLAKEKHGAKVNLNIC